MDFIDKVDNIFPRRSVVKFILLYFFFILLFFIFSSSVFEFFFSPIGLSKNPISKINSIQNILLLTVVIGPFLETLIFQYFLIKGFYLLIENQPFNKTYYNKKTVLISVFLSSIIFGCMHYYSLYYIISMIILGFIFGFVFFLSITRKWYSFPLIFLFHALYNLTILFLERIL